MSLLNKLKTYAKENPKKAAALTAAGLFVAPWSTAIVATAPMSNK